MSTGGVNMEDAARLKDRVDRLYAVWKSGARDAVSREVGQLQPPYNVYMTEDAAYMDAIACRVMPEGWTWQVVELIGGTCTFVVLGFNGREVEDVQR